MKTKRIKIIPMLTAVVIGLSACGVFRNKDEPKEVFSEEKAGEVALAYLNDKYDDEFMITKSGGRKNSIAWGTKWYCADVIRKSDEDKEEPRKYDVSVSWDTTYTVLGDTVMFEYYQDVFLDYAVPIIEDVLGDIQFRLIVRRMTYNDIYDSNYGFLPDTKIPQSVYDENGDYITDNIVFDVCVSESSVENMDIGELCDRIKKCLDENSFNYGYIETYIDERFEEIMSYDSKELYNYFRHNSHGYLHYYEIDNN